MTTQSRLTQAERDLLIELRTEMKAVRADIQDLKDNTKTTVQDHESRLRFIEKYLWMALGILAIIQFVGFAFFFNQLSK